MEKQEMVPVDRVGKLTAWSPVSPIPDGDSYWTSLPMDTEQQRAAAIRYRRKTERASDDVLGAELQLTDLYIHMVTITDEESGEINEAVRVVLISPDRTATQFVSGGVYKSLKDIVSVFGVPPWSPPIIVKVAVQKAKKVGKFFYLEPVGRATTPA